MRQVVLDTETTGLSWERGNRVIEIGCIELLERRPTGRRFQRYLNPGRAMEPGAQEVTGLTVEFLADKPKFEHVVEEFLDFIRGAELIIHNADFDIEFLNMELARCGLGRVQDHVARITDTLLSAKELHPGKRNSLDALCERYFIDNSRRALHGALADALLLADCYLAMTRGQESLMMELEAPAAAAAAAAGLILDVSKLILQQATPEELLSHEQYLDAMEKEAKAPSLWRRILNSA